MNNAEPPTTLLKSQIGPVQDFIAQARSTRDLWSGSYLLSWLVAAGIRAIQGTKSEIQLIFPSPENQNQPLLRDPETFRDQDATMLLTPNLPNIFIARVSASAVESTAACVARAIKDEWTRIAESGWKERDALDLKEKDRDRFFAQVRQHLTFNSLLARIRDASERERQFTSSAATNSGRHSPH